MVVFHSGLFRNPAFINVDVPSTNKDLRLVFEKHVQKVDSMRVTVKLCLGSSILMEVFKSQNA